MVNLMNDVLRITAQSRGGSSRQVSILVKIGFEKRGTNPGCFKSSFRFFIRLNLFIFKFIRVGFCPSVVFLYLCVKFHKCVSVAF